MGEFFAKLGTGCLTFLVLLVIISFIGGYFVMRLYNYCMPDMFGVSKIDYWHAFAFVVMIRLIFQQFNVSSK